LVLTGIAVIRENRERPMETDEAYEVLGLPKTATSEEVRRAYLRLSRKVHSDAGGSDRLFCHVKLAYDTLNAQREGYDFEDREAEHSPSSNTQPTQSSTLARWVRTRPSLALLLSGFVAILFGSRLGDGAAFIIAAGVIALMVGVTGLLGARSTALSAGERSGSALLAYQMKAGAPRLLKAVGVGVLVIVALLTIIGFTRDHSYNRRHRH
jgi:hypothetical protein